MSVHVLLTRETRHLLDATRLARMKPSAILVNTSRGPGGGRGGAGGGSSGAGRLAGAALDVFETEPLDPRSPLTELEDVLLAPHLGSYSVEGVAVHRQRVGQLVLQAATRRPAGAEGRPQQGALRSRCCAPGVRRSDAALMTGLPRRDGEGIRTGGEPNAGQGRQENAE